MISRFSSPEFIIRCQAFNGISTAWPALRISPHHFWLQWLHPLQRTSVPFGACGAATQTLFGVHDNSFHFMVRLISKNAVITPWPVIFSRILGGFWGCHTHSAKLFLFFLERPPRVESGPLNLWSVIIIKEFTTIQNNIKK